jgi:hypothetical protein
LNAVHGQQRTRTSVSRGARHSTTELRCCPMCRHESGVDELKRNTPRCLDSPTDAHFISCRALTRRDSLLCELEKHRVPRDVETRSPTDAHHHCHRHHHHHHQTTSHGCHVQLFLTLSRNCIRHCGAATCDGQGECALHRHHSILCKRWWCALYRHHSILCKWWWCALYRQSLHLVRVVLVCSLSLSLHPV